MKGIDYTRALNREKENFRDDLRLNNEAHEKEVQNMRDKHAYQRTKQSQEYDKSKNRTQQDFEAQINRVSKKSGEKMEQAKANFVRELAEERYDKSYQSGRDRAEFRKNIDDLKNKYNNILANERSAQGQQLDNAKSTYVDNRNKQSVEYQENLRERDLAIKGQISRSKSENADRISHITKENQDIVNEIKRNESDKRNSAILEKNNQLNRIKNQNSEDIYHRQQDYNHTLKDYKEKSAEKVENVKKEYSQSAANQQRQFLKSKEDEKNRHDNVLNDSSARFHKQIAELRQKNSFKKISTDEVDDQAKETKENNERLWRRKIDKLIFNNDTFQKTLTKRADQERKNYIADLRTLKAKHALDSTNDSKQATDRESKLKEKSRVDVDNLKDIADIEQHKINSDWQGKYGKLKTVGENKLNREVSRLNGLMEHFTEQNKMELDSIRKHYNEKQKKIMKNKEIEKSRLVRTLKDQFQEKIDLTATSYEKQLIKKDLDIERQKDFYETKIGDLHKQLRKTAEYKDQLMHEKHEADREFTQTLLDKKEKLFLQKFNDLKNNFEKKITEVMYTNAKKTKKMIGTYEANFETEQSRNAREIQRLTQLYRKTTDRLKQDSKLEMSGVIAKYDARIEKMKNDYEVRIEDIKEKR